VLAGAVSLFLLRKSARNRSGLLTAAAIGATAAAVSVGLACLTWKQTAVWRNTETLWSRVLEIDPNSSFAHYNLARYIARKGRYNEAILHYRQALGIRPDDLDSHNLGLLLATRGEFEELSSILQPFSELILIMPKRTSIWAGCLSGKAAWMKRSNTSTELYDYNPVSQRFMRISPER
jgi:tetratricopeptide (TPR) repeat protein